MLFQPLIISDWSGGIADSDYQGIRNSFAEIIGLDYQTQPGILQLAYKMTATASTIRCKATNILASTTTELYAVGDLSGSPHIYKTTNSGTTWTQLYATEELGQTITVNEGIKGSEIWRGYVFLAGQSALHIYNPTTGSDLLDWNGTTHKKSAIWTGEEVDTDYHPMHQSKGDGSLYIGAGRYLSRLTEATGQTFNPNNSATYTWTSQALDLPPGFRIRSIEEVGNYLILGCWKKSGSSISAVAVIYPWNHILQLDSHEGPISMRRYGGVSAMLNINNRIFAWVGTRGEIFYYTGSGLKKIKKLPFNPGVAVENGAVKANFNDMPVFGVENDSQGLGGVYTYGTFEEGKYPWSLNLPYPLSLGQSVAYEIGAVATAGAKDNVLLVSWKQTGVNTFGIDYLHTTNKLASGAQFTTLLYRLGTAKRKQTTEGIQLILDKALATGQTIDVQYRTNTSASWTTIKIKGYSNTMAFSEVGARTEIFIPYPINNIVNLQFKATFASTANTNILLKEIRIT